MIMSKKSSIRYLILRRILQVALVLVFAGGNYFEWLLLRGNYSAASIFGSVPLADPFAVIQQLAAGAALGMDLLIGAGIVLILYGLILGRVFCSWICPFNLIVDLAKWIRKKFHTGIFKINVSRSVRYYLLVLSIILSAILGFAAYELISPVSLLYRGLIFSIGLGWGLVGSIFILELLSTKDLWCSRICPLGGFYSVTTKYSLLRIFHIEENCTKCNKCFDVCPEVQVLERVGKSTGSIKYGACTNCARCVEVCNDGALKFTIIGKSRKS